MSLRTISLTKTKKKAQGTGGESKARVSEGERASWSTLELVGSDNKREIMADNQLLNNDVGVDDDIFVYTGGEQRVPHDMKRVRIAENIDTIPARIFSFCRQLIEVEGHNRLRKIEEYAFNYCPRLRRVTKRWKALKKLKRTLSTVVKP